VKITLLTAGNFKHDCLRIAAELYTTRCARFAQINTVEIKPIAPKSEAQLVACRRKEGVALLAKIPADVLVVVLDERGRQFTPSKWAAQLGRWRDSGRELCFVVGGAHGLDVAVRQRADAVIALGEMVLTQDLARVVLAEMLYRGFAALAGFPFGK